ncbi:MAG: redoxin domain-containing protein [Bacteroides sp.]|nr:redoxin domain-containing protein [Bacteroides sp.]
MKKTMIIIALFVVLIFTMSSRTDRDYRASVGYAVPELSLTTLSDSSLVNLADMRGHYVMVNFWAAYDAESRVAAGEYERAMRVFAPEQLRLLQVNLDPSSRLFREIVRRDGLNEAQQFTVSASHVQAVERAFNLGNGLQSYLIDPKGNIVAVNPSPQDVAEIIAS